MPNGTWAGVLEAAEQFPWLTSATTVRIKAGGDIDDDGTSSPLGVGAQEIIIQGLDINGDEVMEAVTTAGAGASTSTTIEFIRVFRAWVSVAGVYTGSNTDTIMIENTAGTTDLTQITAGEGQTQFCAYTIPAGKFGALASVLVQTDANKPADFRLFTRKDALTFTPPFSSKRLKFYWDGVLSHLDVRPKTPLLWLDPLTDIWIEANGGGAVTEVSADMEIILYDA